MCILFVASNPRYIVCSTTVCFFSLTSGVAEFANLRTRRRSPLECAGGYNNVDGGTMGTQRVRWPVDVLLFYPP